MSVLFTESFMRYPRVADATALLQAGGINAYNQTSSTTIGVADDPVFAVRNALRMYGVRTSGAGNHGAVANFAADGPIYRAGFRLGMFFIKDGTSLAGAHTTTNVTERIIISRLNPPVGGDLTSVALLRFTVAGANNNDYTVRVATLISGSLQLLDVPFSEDVYVELEVDTTTGRVRAWLNDLLAVDGLVSGGLSTYTQGFSISLRGTQSSSVNGWSVGVLIRDMYILKVDGVAPEQRLGPTTQVIGERPDTDVQAEFARPAGFDTNAAVAAQPLALIPEAFLVGDEAGTRDLYGVSGSVVPSTAARVYAVGVKTMVANYAAGPHTVAAVINDEQGAQVANMPVLLSASGFLNRQHYFSVDSEGNEWTPTSAANASFGLQVID